MRKGPRSRPYLWPPTWMQNWLMATQTHDWHRRKVLRWSQASVQYTAILQGFRAVLQAAYLKVCHKLSRGTITWDQIEVKTKYKWWKMSWKAQTKSREVQGKHETKTEAAERGCLDFNKDTCCLTESTWQPLPCGIWAINCARQTSGTQTTWCSG